MTNINPNTRKTHFKHNFSDLAAKRYSCRTFANKDIEKRKIDLITDFIHSSRSIFKTTFRLGIIQKKELKKENFFTTGTYGMIKGVKTFLAGILEKNSPKSWEDFGYVMQRALMFATDLDINTCWIGGVFDRKTIGKLLNIKKNELIPAVIALGYAADRRVLRDKIVRWGAKGDNRKLPEKLFFYKNLEHPFDYNLTTEYKTLLENIRIAPSASNKQPWRIFFDPGQDFNHFHFFLYRDVIYSKLIPKVDLQRIDMGIAMFHFEQSAIENSIEFSRILKNPKISNLPSNYEYIISYRIFK